MVFLWLTGVLSVDRRLRGGESRMIFLIGASRVWLSFGEEDCELHLDGVRFGVSSDDGCMVSVSVVVFMKESILDGDVYLWLGVVG
ncbi:hypothetical protein A2U01_0039694, partial [Trifolium medium]|nr:hypothetical protein [Trifolium medium]